MKKATIHAPGLFAPMILLCALAFTTSVGMAGHPPKSNPSLDSAAPPLVQFSSQGHILGFQSDGVLVSNAAYALRVNFVGANPVTPHAVSDAQKGNTAAPPFAGATYPNLWDGITLTYDAPSGSIMRSTYTLAPFARVNSIRLRYNAPVTVNSDGTLTAAYGTGQVSESAPIAWQDIDGRRVPVDVAFVAQGAREVGFALGAYNPRAALMIDPIMIWNTFLGGPSGDLGTGIVVDGNGNVYVSGISHGSWGTPVRPYTGDLDDAFAAKLDSGGNLLWNTFLGGTSEDFGSGIAVDVNGNAYVTGLSRFTWGSPIRPLASNPDAFAAKLDSNGQLLWNTFLGGNDYDEGTAIAVDASGNLYVGGISWASWGNPVRPLSGFQGDGFAAKLSTDGALTWNTFLGDLFADVARAIAVDGSGKVYVGGNSNATWGTPVRPYTDFDDAYVAKLGSNGALLWNSFLGGAGGDYGNGLAVDASGNVYLAGESDTTWGTPVRPYNDGNRDGFAAKLNTDGALTWHTFLGGIFGDLAQAITVDSGGNVYATGQSFATWETPVRPHTSTQDAFVAKLGSNGALTMNTFLGGGSFDQGTDIAVDGSGNIYATGTSNATWGSPRLPLTGVLNAFAAKIPAVPSCDEKPEKPFLLFPRDQTKEEGPKINLDWSDMGCTDTYKVILRRNSKKGKVVSKESGLVESQFRTKRLRVGVTYYWRVLAINSFGKGKSAWYSFEVK